MNQYFQFSSKQLKFLSVMASIVVLFTLAKLVQAWSTPNLDGPPMELIIGENDKQFRGSFIIDPNVSPADSLELLPGIGKVLADRIVQYREQKRFEKEIDVINVNGIGPRMYERLKPYLKIKNK